MLLALLVLPLVAANPFHKYPYVFLLDVGNEELAKVDSEQIRLSSPGGSVALRYPAIGFGDDIAHVRVSGVDFGTDLKATILDGGPGYKYVVIVLIGNPGVAYDAVITVQTVPSEAKDRTQTIEDVSNIDAGLNDYEVSEKQNNSAEEYDSAESKASQNKIDSNNEELTQESTNEDYVQNEALSGYGIKNSDNEGENEDDSSNIEQNDVYETDESDASEDKVTDYKEDGSVSQPVAERYTSNSYSQSELPVIVDQNVYNKYEALKSHFNGVEVYPQSSEPGQSYDYRPVDTEKGYDDYEEGDIQQYAYENYKDNSNDASAVEF